MATTVDRVPLDFDAVYRRWRLYLMGHSAAKHFGVVYDPTRVAQFPYANLSLVSRTSNGGDLKGDESSIMLSFETEAYINDNKYLTAYAIDDASADFFITKLGFRRVGDSQLMRVSNTVSKVTSRFMMQNYTGYFLNDLNSI